MRERESKETLPGLFFCLVTNQPHASFLFYGGMGPNVLDVVYCLPRAGVARSEEMVHERPKENSDRDLRFKRPSGSFCWLSPLCKLT